MPITLQQETASAIDSPRTGEFSLFVDQADGLWKYKTNDGTVFPLGSSAVWGAIGGTLSDQTDLQDALDAKLDDSAASATGLALLGAANAAAARSTLGVDAAAKAAAVVDSLAGSQTDQAPSVAVVKAGLDAKQDASTVAELIRDTIGAALVAGANITITVNDAGDQITIAASGGLTNFADGRNNSSPNATVPVHSLTASGAESNIDVAVVPKGTGAFTLQIADGTTAGGNKRGANSIDLQTLRSAATQVASGSGSIVLGTYCTASVGVAMGVLSSCTGTRSMVIGGQSSASGYACAAIGDGSNATTNGSFSFGSNIANGGLYNLVWGQVITVTGHYGVCGGVYAVDRGLTGTFTYSPGRRSANGDAQTQYQMARLTTTNATPSDLTSDGGAVAAGNIMVIPNNSTYVFKAMVVARDTSGNSASWLVAGTAKRGANAASTALVGSTTITTLGADAGMAGAAADVIADTTQGGIKVRVTGIAATTIYWNSKLDTVIAA